MACFHPVNATRLQNGDVKFISPSVVDGTSFKLNCRQCIGCKLEHSRQWALRGTDEAQLHTDNCFVTLTFSPENVLKYGKSLDVSHFQLFMKRLRQDVWRSQATRGIRFLHCGEYTKQLNPHYHAILFGLDFKDKTYWSMSDSGFKLYRSKRLESLWDYGFSTIGVANFESIGYVARYTVKKLERQEFQKYGVSSPFVPSTGEILAPEYITMSRGGRSVDGVNLGGIGKPWYDKFKSDVYPWDKKVIRGMEMKPPRYYDELYKLDDPIGFESIQFDRIKRFDKKDNTLLRLGVKEEVAIARSKLLLRSMENSK